MNLDWQSCTSKLKRYASFCTFSEGALTGTAMIPLRRHPKNALIKSSPGRNASTTLSPFFTPRDARYDEILPVRFSKEAQVQVFNPLASNQEKQGVFFVDEALM